MEKIELRERGQMALETVLVIGLWLIIAFFFLNVLFILSSASLAQSGINRFAVDVGSLGCLPPNSSEIVQEKVPSFASQILNVTAETWPDGNDLIDVAPGSGEELSDCLSSDNEGKADLGAPIRVAVQYRQNVILPSIFVPGGGDALEVTRSTMVTSSRIESGDIGGAP